MAVLQSTTLFVSGFQLTRTQSVSAVNLGAFDDAAFDSDAFVIEEDAQDGIAMQTYGTLTASGIDLTRTETAFS